MGPTARLAEFCAALHFEHIPDAAVAIAKGSLLDLFGIALAGAGAGEGWADIVGYARAAGGGPGPGATLWVTGERLTPGFAALANAACARALDYDDIIEFPQIHVSVCVVPAVLALAESRSHATGAAHSGAARSGAGRCLIEAIVAGCEVQSRLAAALAPRFGTGLPRALPSQILGYFGAAAGAARILGLDARATTSALGLALMQAAGTEEMVVHAAESVGKVLYAGFCNQGGVQCGQMAAAGVKAAGEPLAGEAGLFNVWFGGAFEPAALTDGLGRTFLSERRCVKSMPGTLVAHGFAEAAALALGDLGFGAAALEDGGAAWTADAGAAALREVESVRLEVGPWGRAMSEPDGLRRRPTSASAAMNSVPFIVAKTLAHGRVSVEDFGAAGRSDPAALAWAERIEHRFEPGLASPGRLEPGIVELRTRGGRICRRRIDVPRGHPSRPLSFEHLAGKFRRNAACAPRRPTAAAVEEVIDTVRHLENVDDIGPVLSRLAALSA